MCKALYVVWWSWFFKLGVVCTKADNWMTDYDVWKWSSVQDKQYRIHIDRATFFALMKTSFFPFLPTPPSNTHTLSVSPLTDSKKLTLCSQKKTKKRLCQNVSFHFQSFINLPHARNTSHHYHHLTLSLPCSNYLLTVKYYLLFLAVTKLKYDSMLRSFPCVLLPSHTSELSSLSCGTVHQLSGSESQEAVRWLYKRQTHWNKRNK